MTRGQNDGARGVPPESGRRKGDRAVRKKDEEKRKEAIEKNGSSKTKASSLPGTVTGKGQKVYKTSRLRNSETRYAQRALQ